MSGAPVINGLQNSSSNANSSRQDASAYCASWDSARNNGSLDGGLLKQKHFEWGGEGRGLRMAYLSTIGPLEYKRQVGVHAFFMAYLIDSICQYVCTLVTHE